MKFVVGENGRHPEKNLPRPRFVHHETHMEGPRRDLGTPAVGGERLTACATRPLCPFYALCIYLFISQLNEYIELNYLNQHFYHVVTAQFID